MNGRGECTATGFTCYHRVYDVSDLGCHRKCDSSTPELCPYFKNTGTVTDEREEASTGFKYNSAHEMFEDLAKHDEAFRPIPCKPRKLTKKQRERNRKIDAWVRKTLKDYARIREASKDSTLVFDA